jgi:hypothetical protein
MEAMVNKCKDCRFFVPHPHDDGLNELKGECHRNPPQFTKNGSSSAKFPQVDPLAEPCGEFKAEQE